MKVSRIHKNKTLICTACSKGSDAEVLHPQLQVPICGACSSALIDADLSIERNRVSCVWCGEADGCILYMCDSCIFSYCSDCIVRNFGQKEADIVKAKDSWTCYICEPTYLIRSLQVFDDLPYHNIDKAYDLVKPPKDMDIYCIDQSILETLSLGEKLFASFFTNKLFYPILFDLGIVSEYLQTYEIFPKIYRISKKLRRLFKSRIFVIPGLFRTEYGMENKNKLFQHQMISLFYMNIMENKSSRFGSLRGGIFGDEPGLGKTVTTIALIASTAGTMTQNPQEFWDRDQIAHQWKSMKGQYSRILNPVLNSLLKSEALGYFVPVPFKQILSNLEKFSESIFTFEHAVKRAIKLSVRSQRDQIILINKFRNEMNHIKESLNPKRRKITQSFYNKRVVFEKKLIPSSATLIVVPSTLLEHWFEQISRHLNLDYFSQDRDRRGVVYLDGLGDIVDIHPPLSKFRMKAKSIVTEPSEVLANYLIVVTTFDRLSLEYKQSHHRMSANEFPFLSNPLLLIRWLRLVVDEGHELGSTVSNTDAHSKSTNSSTRQSLQTTTFLCKIAAERRWIMSGTPTTGSNSLLGLRQLYRLLGFLRHRLYFNPSSFLNETHMNTINNKNNKRKLASMNKSHATGLDDESITEAMTKGIAQWDKYVVKPCLGQDPQAWLELIELLKSILLRHTKDDIKLFEPIRSTVNILPEVDSSDPIGDKILCVDRAKAKYIAKTMLKAKEDWIKVSRDHYYSLPHHRQAIVSPDKLTTDDSNIYSDEMLKIQFQSRRPKAIVFSQHENDLQGVGHFLYLLLGDSHICEHFGSFRSSELSRFRNSTRKFRQCPLCGHQNQINNDMYCDKVLILVEYINNNLAGFESQSDEIKPCPGGHGSYGPGGHYVGPCLCSPIGCFPSCQRGLPNLFYKKQSDGLNLSNPNYAIIAEEHIHGWRPGMGYQSGQIIDILPSDPYDTCLQYTSPQANFPYVDKPFLWKDGRMGGRAIIRYWRKCGGSTYWNGWHNEKILESIPWQFQEEDASILLLKEDGSTGLDLSFATHIFLLERIKDPALRNQIVSRAHRMGATGPVHVQLVQVIMEDDA